MIEHYIQREIMGALSRAESLRYSELKPDGMESNIFMYHMNQLIRTKYVSRADGGYALATKGLQYVDTLSYLNLKPRPQPKVLTILAVEDKAGKWLLAKRKTQPYLNQLMLPSGKRHFGELSDKHAKRELHEKTGWELSLQHKGCAEIIISAGNETLTHITGDIYYACSLDSSMPTENDRFDYKWCRTDFRHDYYLPGTFEILRALASQPDKNNHMLSFRFTI